MLDADSSDGIVAASLRDYRPTALPNFSGPHSGL